MNKFEVLDQIQFGKSETFILECVCEKFGFEKQCAKAVEEHCELITEVYKYGGKGVAISKIPCCPELGITYEVADCLIMQAQMRIFEQWGFTIPGIVLEMAVHCHDYLRRFGRDYPNEVRERLREKLERLEKLLNE